jgi:uncharacterized membrane protein YbaN (DUF454 family)
VGAVGLILPIIPGLLFLAIAGLIAAKHSSSVDRFLRRSPTLSGYLDSADGFVDLPVLGKIQFGVLLCLRMLIDAVAFAVSAVARLINLAAGKPARARSPSRSLPRSRTAGG